jgi:hypothetical protein
VLAAPASVERQYALASPLSMQFWQFCHAAYNRPSYLLFELQTSSQKKWAGALGRISAQVTPALSMLLVKWYDELSALHVDGYGFGKLKLERRFRPQLDVFLACH